MNQVDEFGFLGDSTVDDGQQHYDGTIRNSFITTRDLVYWAYQISRGMAFLVGKKVCLSITLFQSSKPASFNFENSGAAQRFSSA